MLHQERGIGLHLNNIINSIPTDRAASMKLAVNSMGILGIKSASITSCHSMENIESCSDAFEQVSAAPQGGTLEAKVCTIVGSAVSESLRTMESIECHMTLNAKRMLSSEDGDNNQQSPKKKRQVFTILLAYLTVITFSL